MSTLGSPRPLHPFPHLADPTFRPHPAPGASSVSKSAPSRHQRHLLALLAQGARILFDIEAKRALVLYQGFKSAGEMTVRALAELIRQGLVVMTGREGRLILYALA